jgi:hypothetical protein
MKTVWLTVGFAAGYVLGAKAGRERYEQIARATREFLNTPEITEAQAKVKQMAERGREAVREKLHTSSTNGSERRVEPAEPAFPTPVG